MSAIWCPGKVSTLQNAITGAPPRAYLSPSAFNALNVRVGQSLLLVKVETVREISLGSTVDDQWGLIAAAWPETMSSEVLKENILRVRIAPDRVRCPLTLSYVQLLLKYALIHSRTFELPVDSQGLFLIVPIVSYEKVLCASEGIEESFADICSSLLRRICSKTDNSWQWHSSSENATEECAHVSVRCSLSGSEPLGKRNVVRLRSAVMKALRSMFVGREVFVGLECLLAGSLSNPVVQSAVASKDRYVDIKSSKGADYLASIIDKVDCVVTELGGVRERKRSPVSPLMWSHRTMIQAQFVFNSTGDGSGKEEIEYEPTLDAHSSISRLVHRTRSCRVLFDLIELPRRCARDFQSLQVSRPTGLLLSGPPGVGKTWSVRTVCDLLRIPVHNVDVDFLYGGAQGSLRGEAERRLRVVFLKAKYQAKQSGATSVIFLDELDVLCPMRSDVAGSSGAASANDVPSKVRLTAQLLTLMDGFDNGSNQSDNVVVVAATNRPEAIDTALRRAGRFDRELTLTPPNAEDRFEILRYYAESLPLTTNCLRSLRTIAAHECVGMVGADLMQACRRAVSTMLESAPAASNNEGSSCNYRISVDVLRRSCNYVGASSQRSWRSVREEKDRLDNDEESSGSGAWRHFAGYEKLKRKIRELIEYGARYVNEYRRLGLKRPKGILLYGPPGTGKTTLARVVAQAAGLAFQTVRGPDIFSCYVGEAERQLRMAFKQARANSPCVLFLDEIDAIVGNRGFPVSNKGESKAKDDVENEDVLMDNVKNHATGFGSGASKLRSMKHSSLAISSDPNSMESRVLSTLLNEMDGVMGGDDGVTVLAACNRPQALDAALLRPGRFDHILYVPLPDYASRLAILGLHMRRMQVFTDEDGSGRKVHVHLWAQKLEGYSGADIRNFCKEAAMCALREAVRDFSGSADRNEMGRVTNDHFVYAFSVTSPSVSQEVVRVFALTLKEQLVGRSI